MVGWYLDLEALVGEEHCFHGNRKFFKIRWRSFNRFNLGKAKTVGYVLPIWKVLLGLYIVIDRILLKQML